MEKKSNDEPSAPPYNEEEEEEMITERIKKLEQELREERYKLRHIQGGCGNNIPLLKHANNIDSKEFIKMLHDTGAFVAGGFALKVLEGSSSKTIGTTDIDIYTWNPNAWQQVINFFCERGYNIHATQSMKTIKYHKYILNKLKLSTGDYTKYTIDVMLLSDCFSQDPVEFVENSFDINVCMTTIKARNSKEYTIILPPYYDDINAKVVRWCPGTHFRVAKYCSKGYRFDNMTYNKAYEMVEDRLGYDPDDLFKNRNPQK